MAEYTGEVISTAKPYEGDVVPLEPERASPLMAYLKLGRAAMNVTPFGPALGIPQKIGELSEKLGTKAGDFTLEQTDSPLLATMARLSPDIAAMLAGGGLGQKAIPALERTAAGWMQSAIKPTAGELERGSGQRAVQTALNEGISVGKGGLEKLQSLIDPYEKRISQILTPSTATVPESAFARSFGQAMVEAKYSPPAESKAIAKSIDDFKDKFYPGGGSIPVQDIQKIKQAYYRALGPESYGVITSGERTGMKAVARGAKEAVAAAEPAIVKENDALGPLLNAMDVIERRVNLAPNRDIGGLAWLAHNIKGLVLALVARDPYTKSMLARGLHSSAGTAAPAVGAAAGLGAAELNER